jgi:hypothetical protein
MTVCSTRFSPFELVSVASPCRSPHARFGRGAAFNYRNRKGGAGTAEPLLKEFKNKLSFKGRGGNKDVWSTNGKARAAETAFGPKSRSPAEGAPDVSAQERPEHEFIKRIAKLRWVGMKAEAELLLLSKLHRLEPRGAPLTSGTP